MALYSKKNYSQLVFIAGMHASGKSVLVASLDDIPNLILFPRLRRKELFTQRQFQALVQKKSNFVDVKRCLLERLDDYYKEFHFQIQLAQLNPRHFILCDRCPIDGLAYIEACYKLDWLDAGESDKLRKNFRSVFKDIEQLANGIFLQPPLQWIERNFKERLKARKSRFWEQKSNFIQASYYAFEKIYKAHISNTDEKWIKIKSVNLDERKQCAEDYINFLVS